MIMEIKLQELEQMAKVRLSETEHDTTQIIDFLVSDFKKLPQIDTTDVKPLVHGIELLNVFREDCTNKTISREKLLESAPEHHDGYFEVPKTLE